MSKQGSLADLDALTNQWPASNCVTVVNSTDTYSTQSLAIHHSPEGCFKYFFRARGLQALYSLPLMYLEYVAPMAKPRQNCPFHVGCVLTRFKSETPSCTLHI